MAISDVLLGLALVAVFAALILTDRSGTRSKQRPPAKARPADAAPVDTGS
jgi:hypothetical protein